MQRSGTVSEMALWRSPLGLGFVVVQFDGSAEDMSINIAMYAPASSSTYLHELGRLEATVGNMLQDLAEFLCKSLGMAPTRWSNLKRSIVRSVSLRFPSGTFSLKDALCKATAQPT